MPRAKAKIKDKNMTTKEVREPASWQLKPKTDVSKVDKMEVGFHFPFGPPGKTPRDYLFEWKNDKWMHGGQAVSGWKLIDLTEGIDLKTMHLPPLATWQDGFWFSALLQELEEDIKPAWVENLICLPNDTMVKKLTEGVKDHNYQFTDAWDTWCVSGDGMPGAWAYYCYVLPYSQASGTVPKHPVMWTEAEKAWTGKKPMTATYQAYQPSSWQSTPAPPKKPEPPPMPTGLRMRCIGCGHWFKEGDLAGHVTWACAGSEDSTGNWAIMCVSECGCRTLDEASTCKDGFPKTKPVITSDAPKEENA